VEVHGKSFGKDLHDTKLRPLILAA